MYRILILSLIAILGWAGCQTTQKDEGPGAPTQQATSLLGKELISQDPSIDQLGKLAEAKKNFEEDPSLDNLIWVGRFIAYTGDYRKAIDWYSTGLEQYPNESRLYRHRGHRYISVREFDLAIADLEKAAELIAGATNTVEPDGAPNAQGIPVSTRHGNIWYHLGLTYYLTGQYEKALSAYQNCLNIELSNDDNLVSATHWITLILGKLNREEEASQYLAAITDSLNIIENHSYWRTCQFYKGEIAADSLVDLSQVTPGTVAQAYGVAAFTAQNQGEDKAKPYYDGILKTRSWASFGFIAAEADRARTQNHP
ncbi:MAG: tetratricopeptide repeat protein [Bacteroidota bacterium]